MNTEGWTVKEAADLLTPKVPYRTLALWVRFHLTPIGTRETGKPGRPPFLYSKDELRALHERIVNE